MHGANQIFGPASETYAGFAWDYLRRNKNYCDSYDDRDQSLDRNANGSLISSIRYAQKSDDLANRWGLECFAAPNNDALKAHVVWRQEAFPGALSIYYHKRYDAANSEDQFNLKHLDCEKQHYVRSDGTRITILKSEGFWLQLSGKPTDVESEDQSFSVMIDGRKGSRRRIDALRQLTSLSRNGTKGFKLLGRQKAFLKMRNALTAYDIKANGGSYKDVAIALFGTEKVQCDWDSSGGFLKARAIRSFKFGERMVLKITKICCPKRQFSDRDVF